LFLYYRESFYYVLIKIIKFKKYIFTDLISLTLNDVAKIKTRSS